MCGLFALTRRPLNQRGNGIASLWRDPGIQQTIDRSSEFQMDDSAPYFFQNLARIAGEGYKPTNEDILNVRAKTTGIVETEFIHNGLHFRCVLFAVFWVVLS